MADIVVAGGGIAGLEAALHVERKTGRTVTIIDPDPQMVFYPTLHRVLEGKDLSDVQIDLVDKFTGRNIEHVAGRVTGMDADEGVLQLEDEEIAFQDAVVAVGSVTSYGSIEGDGHVHDLRFRDDAADIADALAAGDVDDVVVIGGGATGVEATASLYEASDALENFSITLLEGRDALLPQYVPAVGRLAEEDYRSRGIDVRTGTEVSRIGAGEVVLQSGEELRSDLTVWAGGVAPNPVIHDLGLDTTDDGLAVDGYMRCEEGIYAAGDATDYDGKVNRAFYALHEAKTVAENIARKGHGRKLREHTVGWSPNLIYLGRGDALFELGGFTWRGRLPALLRSIGVEKRYLWTRRHLL